MRWKLLHALPGFSSRVDGVVLARGMPGVDRWAFGPLFSRS